MAYDPEIKDRSYLFGCLLAIADKAESVTYEKGEYRVTNARRYWNAFSQRPCQIWGIIEGRLEPYLEKKEWVMKKYTRHFDFIMSKISTNDFSDNSKLTSLYLLGYHHYHSLLEDEFKHNEEEK